MSGKNKIVKYRRNPILNIGTILFGILFLYMIICLFLYLTSKHITAYEVTAGPLSGNYRYTGLALKSETVMLQAAHRRPAPLPSWLRGP